MFYFAYGSNMDWNQMRRRCPSARFIGVAVLPDHRLAFTRLSTTRGCGVADAVEHKRRRVWGAVFDIDEGDLHRLDDSEGYQPGRRTNSYWRRSRQVLLEGDKTKPLTAAVYFAERQPHPPPPSKLYKALILRGAEHWKLPAAYIKTLSAIKVVRG
jgi:gamma-glutamylcyclotransferase (GGCT)/AIG2-like uncharacterized protein YtfP